MPGMMDTILNLGLNEDTVEALAGSTGNRTFALDCYRRFLQMYGDVVLNIEHSHFERALEKCKEAFKVQSDQQLPSEGWEKVIARYKQIIEEESGGAFPQNPHDQLLEAIKAVFASWNNPRAVVYRRLNQIPDHLSTAVISRRWFSAIWERIAVQVWLLPETLLRVRNSFTASFCSMPRGKMLWPVYAHLCLFPL